MLLFFVFLRLEQFGFAVSPFMLVWEFFCVFLRGISDSLGGLCGDVVASFRVPPSFRVAELCNVLAVRIKIFDIVFTYVAMQSCMLSHGLGLFCVCLCSIEQRTWIENEWGRWRASGCDCEWYAVMNRTRLHPVQDRLSSRDPSVLAKGWSMKQYKYQCIRRLDVSWRCACVCPGTYLGLASMTYARKTGYFWTSQKTWWVVKRSSRAEGEKKICIRSDSSRLMP